MLAQIWHRLNSIAVRFALDGSDDTKGHQGVRGSGRAGELYGDAQNPIGRLQQAGLSSRPSKGTGIVINLDGNSDKPVVVVLENPDKRPTNLDEGETIVYDEFGDYLKLDKNGQATLKCKSLVIQVDGAVTITAGGKIIVQAPEVHLGADGGKPVAVLGSMDSAGNHITDGCADKVFAV